MWRLIIIWNQFHSDAITPGGTNNRIQAEAVWNRLANRSWVIGNATSCVLRRQWVAGHLNWTSNQRIAVLLTNASHFCVRRENGRSRVCHKVVARYTNVCVQDVDRYGGGSAMVSVGISLRNYIHILHNVTSVGCNGP